MDFLRFVWRVERKMINFILMLMTIILSPVLIAYVVEFIGKKIDEFLKYIIKSG